ncbi:MAG: aspartate aminotransferase family protein [Chloroflexi bacterium]|nr:aspartate aminotransferase family protein [Chloroflexota bacterium]
MIQRNPTIIREGHGLTVTDIDGKDYIDALSGIWVVNIGHGNQAVIEAMQEQLKRLTFSYPVGTVTEPAIQLAKLLSEIVPAPLTTVKLLNSGSEATETALKLARQYFLQSGHPRKYKVISRYLAWHGATMGALSMSGVASLKAPFEPLLEGFLHVPPHSCYRCPYGLAYSACNVACARVIEKVLEWEDPETVAAIIVDPVMVAPGVLVPPKEYLPIVRDICDRHNVLLIFDEVITGFGRTGQLFAMNTFGVVPDIVALAKGMGSGYAPLAATVCSDRVAAAFWGDAEDHVEFMHGHTFGANPLSATAGLASITQLLQTGMLENAARVGAYLQQRGQDLYKHPIVGDVRGIGMMLGAELVADRTTRAPFPAGVAPGQMVLAACKRRGLIMRGNPNWIAFGPPMITTEADIDRIFEIVDAGLDEVEAEALPA